MRRIHIRLAVVLVSTIFTTAQGQSPANVLLVVNTASAASVEIGSYYAQKRGIPAENILRLQTVLGESIERADFERQIETPIAAWLTRTFGHDRILYIVLTKGFPLRINGTGGQDGTVASVDSELTLLYRKLTGIGTAPAGKVNNPYFLGEGSAVQRRVFTHEQFDIFLVSRLDGYTVTDVRGLIDRGASPVREGTIILDDRASSPNNANAWLKSAADILRSSFKQNPVTYDTTATVVRDAKSVLGYYSWGSNDPAIKDRQFNLTFSNGALAGMFVSTDGRTMNEPPADWKIGNWDDGTTHFAGSPQSLVGDFIRAGVSGIAGHVTEPYLDATIRPNILFPSYLAGANLVEAFYLAMPYLSWQTVVIGDPLCAPFRTTGADPTDISKGLDPETELPAFFTAHRLKFMTSTAVNPVGIGAEALKRLMRGDARISKNDLTGAQQALEEATALDDRLGAAHLMLGLLYDQAAAYDKAIERYRRVIAAAPDNLVALNNLAYDLGVRQGAVKEALPFAERAFSLGKGNPNTTDTLAWILHLDGDDARARALFAEATQANPQNAILRFHFAAVLAALGEEDRAREELSQALQLDSRLASNSEVEQLRARLKQ